MTILSGQTIRRLGIIEPCLEAGRRHGVSYGLGPAGYDLTLDFGEQWAEGARVWLAPMAFILAATVEHFDMPTNIVGLVKDKSTMARRGLSVFNTVIEPGWRGFLTLELVNHGPEDIPLVQGQGIAQVLFQMMDEHAETPYNGKYQDQAAGPQGPRK